MNYSMLTGALFAIAAIAPAAAAEPINMIGTWKGDATAVHVGANPYRETEGSAPNLPSKVLEFTFVITEQQGNRFVGKSTAGDRSETIVGSLSPDGHNGIMLDDDGQYLLSVQSPDTVDVCYFHATTAGKVAACYTIKRAG